MAVFNDSSTGYSGVLPDDRNEARDDGLLNQYAHMYDVIKEDRYREKAIESESVERTTADATLQKNIENESGERKTADSELNAHIVMTQNKIDDVVSDIEKINSVQPRNVISAPTVGNYSVAIGNGASAGDSCVTVGTASKSTSTSVTVGVGNTVSDGVAIGVSASASNGIAIGRGAKATSDGTCAIGDNAKATYIYSTAIGAGVETERNYEVRVGAKNYPRYVANVKDPELAQDAVTKAYLDNRISESLATYLATLPDIDFGYTSSFDLDAGKTKIVDFYFSSYKTEAPSLFVTPYCNVSTASLSFVVTTVGTHNASVVVTNNSTSKISNITLDWLAISGR